MMVSSTIMSSATSASSDPSTAKELMPNPSLVVTTDHQIKLESAPINEPGPSDVLLHVRASGICGSDIHFWRHGKIGDISIDGDCILGHESAAVVLKTGSNVTHLKNGKTILFSEDILL